MGEHTDGEEERFAENGENALRSQCQTGTL